MKLALLLAVLAVPALADKPALTKEKADALLENVERTSDLEYHPGLALSRALGVPTSEKEPYRTVFFARRRLLNGVDHTLSRAKGIEGWMFHVSDKTGERYLRVDGEFKIAGTAVYRKGDGEPQPMREEDAKKFLVDEAALWTASPAPKKR